MRYKSIKIKLEVTAWEEEYGPGDCTGSVTYEFTIGAEEFADYTGLAARLVQLLQKQVESEVNVARRNDKS